MAGTAASIDQAIFEARRGIDYLRPAVVRPYLEFAEIPSNAVALKALREYYLDKAIGKKLAVSSAMTADLEKKLKEFVDFGRKMRTDLEKSFAENEDKIESRHLDNLGKWAEDLEKMAHENSAEGVALFKPLRKKFSLLAREYPHYKEDFADLLARIFTAGDKSAEEFYNMALFLRALRAEYHEDSAYFTERQDMKAYLKGLVA